MHQMRRLLELLGIDIPIVQAPMAGSTTPELVAAVSNAGGLGSHGAAMLTSEQVIEDVGRVRALSNRGFNLNFFCHAQSSVTAEQERAWRDKLDGYYAELGVDPAAAPAGSIRKPFDEVMCDAVVALRPRVVSFHFGLPQPDLVERVKEAGCVVLCSATTVAEARHLVERGVDAVIAQGSEAGGHRGMFLNDDISTQAGTLALVPQIVDAVQVPVIAAGGIADARGVAAAFALGATAAQVGTAYLFCPEANVSALHRAALKEARDDGTALTNLFTGRPARGLVNRLMREQGPMNATAPAFPEAAAAILPLRSEAERRGVSDFSSLWSGQAAALGRESGAGELTRRLAAEAFALLGELGDEARRNL